MLVAQSYLILWDPMDCSPPRSSVHEILQARILERVAIPFPGGSSWSRDQNWVSCIASRFFTIWAIREAQDYVYKRHNIGAVLIPTCDWSRLAFCMMYSEYKLNKQGDSIQPWCTPFPIWNQSVAPCPVLTVASWPAYRFFRREVRWSGTIVGDI